MMNYIFQAQDRWGAPPPMGFFDEKTDCEAEFDPADYDCMELTGGSQDGKWRPIPKMLDWECPPSGC